MQLRTMQYDVWSKLHVQVCMLELCSNTSGGGGGSSGGGDGGGGGGIGFSEAAQTHTNFAHHGFHSNTNRLQQGNGHNWCRNSWNIG